MMCISFPRVMYHSLTCTYDAYHSLLIVDLVEQYKLTCQYSSKHKIANLIKSNFYLYAFLVVTLKPFFLQFLFCTILIAYYGLLLLLF